ICDAADSASLDSFSSARFSDIILSKAGRGVGATLLRPPPRARLETLRRLLARELFFALSRELFFALSRELFFAPLFAGLCAAASEPAGQARPKQITKTNRRIN